MKLPQKPSTDVLMVCNSSGIAPFRAFIQHKNVELKNKSESCFGKMILFFGSRHRSKDYIFKDEIEVLVSDITLTAVFEAFSRDDTKKVYVQDIIQTKKDMFQKYLFESKGILYLCGSNGMINDVLQVIKDLIGQIFNNLDEVFIEEEYQKLRQNGQIIFEGWG